MKKVLIGLLCVVLIAVLAVGGFAGYRVYQKYAPTSEKADPYEYFHASGDEVAVVLDNVLLDETQGRLIDGAVYLPLDWVSGHLNERFYWADDVHLIIYVLPEEIVYLSSSTLSPDGFPVLVEDEAEDVVWLLASTVSEYTDVRIEEFPEDEVRRVFIDTLREPVSVGELRRKGNIRRLGGIKSPVLTQLPKDSTVEILDTLDNWVKVRTGDGYIGYVERLLVRDIHDEEPVSTFEAPVYTNLTFDEPIIMVWHQVMGTGANDTVRSYMANTKGVNVVAPTWFMLTDNEGGYACHAQSSYVDWAHQRGLMVWAVLDNFNMGDNVRSEVLFSSTAARERLIGNLMEDILRYNIDGINIDIESIPPSAGVHYIQFIRELSVSCREYGIYLSVDTYVPSAYTSFYDRAEQGKVADYVVIMGYDEHYAGDEAGSVASLPYEEQGIIDTLEMVPAEKIISGIPFYTRVWKVDSDGRTTSDALSLADAAAWVRQTGVELEWDDELGQYYGERTSNGTTSMIWLEDERSLELKAQLAKDYGLAGIACWKLGFDTPAVWDVLQPD